ncbi:beta-galactosidase [Mesobacillus foraminis]|uniref:beta-galactosidase n=1 Tax=Mesobacillus foraminis TaxID=279826 RepID=UPI001BE843BD|nr:beta-galactosidase [Mesobacillus foraminis]MBT2759559.1 beta-galactosidase [Mesobacillus foraminis]
MNKIHYGGDYNPEQWPEEIWSEDMALFEEAHIDTLTVGVFSWSMIQKDEETYDFSLMDKIMERLHKEGKKVCLATGTAAHPAWMARKYPEVTRTDFQGLKHKFGQRHNSCPNSPVYKGYSRLMAQKMAERYAGYDNIIAWHVNNEYGGSCYCENCEKAFRNWLHHKYGTIEKLNEAWNTMFWSHYFYDWDDIVVPNALSEHYGRENVTAFQGITLDYMRFNSDSLLNNFLSEKEELNKITPAIPVTTNFMGMYRPLGYFKWAKHLDFISWDNYPPDMKSEARMALTHDLMRGLKNGQPFWLMEQTPTTTACRDINPVKRPGVMRLWSYQAIAHGSDSVLFFQMRQSKGASEKYHGALINHAGRNDTRFFIEARQLGEELSLLGDQLTGSETSARVAMVFDWDSWWAVEISDGPSRHISYQQTMIHFYKALFALNIPVDVIGPDTDLDQYDVVIAPLLHIVKDDYHKKAEQFTAKGGTFITTFLSGIVDENDNAILDDRPGLFKKLLGIRIDETDTLLPQDFNSICVESGELKGEYPCSMIFDVVKTLGAETIGTYGKDFYANTPAVTRNKFGGGEAWYIASYPDLDFLKKLFKQTSSNYEIACKIESGEGVEITERKKGDEVFTFVLNHAEEEREVALPKTYHSLLDNQTYEAGMKLKVKAKDVVILKG